MKTPRELSTEESSLVDTIMEIYPKTPKAEKESYLSSLGLSVLGWLWINWHCSHARNWEKLRGLYSLQVTSLQKALEKAKTLLDWVCIAEYSKRHRVIALDKVVELAGTDDADAIVLYNSYLERLSNIGWYLLKKNNIAL